MRLLVVCGILMWMPSFQGRGFPVEKSPEGLARLLDTTWLADNTWFRVVLCGVWAGVVLYLAGGLLQWVKRPAGAIRDLLTPAGLTLAFLGISLVQSNRNSQDATHHGYQALALVLLTQAVVFWYAFLRNRRPAAPHLRWEDWGIHFSIQTLAACYFVAGWSKLKNSGIQWVIDSPLIVTHMVRTGDEYYYDTLDESRLGSLDGWIQWFLGNPGLVRIGMGASLVLELLAVLALLGPRWALLIGIAIELLHWGIGQTMRLYFPVNQVLVLAFLINVPRWILAAIPRRSPGVAAAVTSASPPG